MNRPISFKFVVFYFQFDLWLQFNANWSRIQHCRDDGQPALKQKRGWATWTALSMSPLTGHMLDSSGNNSSNFVFPSFPHKKKKTPYIGSREKKMKKIILLPYLEKRKKKKKSCPCGGSKHCSSLTELFHQTTNGFECDQSCRRTNILQ